ncbi:MAG TPA: class I adenylate cyclase [Spirochaetota bacterium]|nr:class I adenylate cyclase [Spirochaetota bacterium]
MEFFTIIKNNKERFIEYNSRKFERFQELLPGTAVSRVVNAIPFLLSINNRKLPGYIDGEVPRGIVNYELDNETRKYLKSRFSLASADRDPVPDFIEMLAIMGSIGTVAYNKKSDFDYWVCVNKRSVSQELLENFQKKAEDIQKWATKETGVPVHLFINDITDIKNSIFAEDDEEAFGSTVGAVLKDEFLRSSIIIAGKIPFWWAVPHFVKNDEYDSFYERLTAEMKEKEFVDLGNLYEISKEDFLGSALFQIIKSLGNPFKSIIKIGVLEKYLFGEGFSLLCQKIKMNIHQGTLSQTMLDSYLFMFEEVYDHYSGRLKDPALLTILRQNLYLKVDPQISRYAGVKDKKNIPYKVSVMLSYVKNWGWDIATIKDLDNFDNWDFTRVMAFWDTVKKFMLLSYQSISSQLPGMNLQNKISDSDFTLLSRMITTHFRKQDNKIEQLISFKDTAGESVLYMEPRNQGVKASQWVLSKRDRSSPHSFSTITIRTEEKLPDLLAWMAINNIYDPGFTRLNIQSGYIHINQNAVTELLGSICSFFSGKNTKIKNEYYLQPEFKLLNMIIINFNLENIDSVKTIHHLYLTSWGESFCKEYNSENDLSHILFDIIKNACCFESEYERYCAIITPEPYKKHYKTIHGLFRSAYSSLIEDRSRTSARFIAPVGDHYISLRREGNRCESTAYKNILNLMAAVSLKPGTDIKYTFFGEGLLGRLSLSYRIVKPHAITILYEETSDIVIAYLFNEEGNLFVFFKPAKQKNILLANLYGFTKCVSAKINSTQSMKTIVEKNFRILRICTDAQDSLTLKNDTKMIEELFLGRTSLPRGIRVSVVRDAGEDTFYEVIFPDTVSSGLMTINEIYAVSDKIRAMRNNGDDIIPLIEDISIADKKRKGTATGSTPYLMEKYKLECIIEKHMK